MTASGILGRLAELQLDLRKRIAAYEAEGMVDATIVAVSLKLEEIMDSIERDGADLLPSGAEVVTIRPAAGDGALSIVHDGSYSIVQAGGSYDGEIGGVAFRVGIGPAPAPVAAPDRPGDAHGSVDWPGDRLQSLRRMLPRGCKMTIELARPD